MIALLSNFYSCEKTVGDISVSKSKGSRILAVLMELLVAAERVFMAGGRG